MELSLYNVAQQELYKISRLGWRNFNNHLLEFSHFNLVYNKQYGIDCMTEIDAAEALTTENIYININEENRVMLTRAVDGCLIKWQNLKRYILKAYNTDLSMTMLNNAGQLYYDDASNYNWQNAILLVNKAATFIKDQKLKLIANENMPPNFGDSFNGTKDALIELQAKVFGPAGDTTQNKQNKIKANNAIFIKLTNMLQDGQQLFLNKESIAQQFVFDDLKAIISGMDQSGIRGFITDAETGFPITAATISPSDHAFVTITNNSGLYNLKLAIGNYLVTISAIGYVSQTKTITVTNDMISLLNVKLSSVAASN